MSVCYAFGRLLRSAPVLWHLRRDVPRAYRRQRALFSITVGVTWGAAYLVSIGPLGAVVGERALAGIGLGGVVTVLAWWAYADRRLRRQLLAADWRLCPICLYDLSGLDDESTCPECGTPYRHEDVRAMWRRSGVIPKA